MTHYLFTIALLPPAVFALFWAVKRKKHTGMAAGFWFDMFLVTLGVCALLAALAYPDSAASFLFLVCAALVFAFLLLFGVYILLGAFALEYGADAQAGTAEPQAYADADPCSGDPCAYGASVGFGQKSDRFPGCIRCGWRFWGRRSFSLCTAWCF